METDQPSLTPEQTGDREQQDRDDLARLEAICIGFDNYRLVADICYESNTVEEAAVSLAAALDLSPQETKTVLDQQFRGLTGANRRWAMERRDEMLRGLG